MRLDLIDILERHSRFLASKIALIDDAGKWTYAALWKEINEVERCLKDLEFQNRKRVGLALQPGKAYVAALLGAIKAGLAVVPLNTRLTGSELDLFLDRVQPHAVIVDVTNSEITESINCTSYLADLRDSSWKLQRMGRSVTPSTPPDFVQSDEAIIIGTGGTTGVPKGAVVNRTALWMWSICGAFSQQIRVDDVELFGSPFFHSTILTGLLTPLGLGATVRIIDRFTLENVDNAVRADSVTRIGGAPTMLMRIFDEARHNPDSWNGVRTVQFWSTKSPPGFVEAVHEALPSAQLMTGYGATEFGPATRLYDADIRNGGGGVGRPVPSSAVAILKPDSEELTTDPDVVGEIAVRCPWQMSSYTGPPEETSAAFLSTGEILSGDIGQFDSAGYLHLRGRRKEIIITGGENVFPSEVEEVLCNHAHIREAAVYGVDDDVWGERVEAAIVQTHGSPITLEELRNFCRQHLAGYKIPRSMVQVSEMPLTSNLKIDKRGLASQTDLTRSIWINAQ